MPKTSVFQKDVFHFHSSQLIRALEGEYKDSIGMLMIVDCRYGYEFSGGHIRGAVNFTNTADATAFLMESCMVDQYSSIRAIESGLSRKPLVVVFHCEFSQQRGPRM